VPYLFGPNSLPAYVQAAKKRQVNYTLVENANLALDIDTIDDLRTLEQYSRAWSGMASLTI
jgi:2-phospho-L-lactate guanylyltransferase (CobY/MobA/RfbA family)